MSLKIGGHLFTGPFPLDKARLKANEAPAVWAIICRAGKPWNPVFRLLAAAQSADTNIVYATHPDRAAWEAAAEGAPLGVYFMTCPRSEGYDDARRQDILTEIVTQYPPPHGEIPLTVG